MARTKVKTEDYQLDVRKPTTRTDEEAGESPLDKGPTVATGLGVRTGELEALSSLAGELGITKNKLMRFALRYVIIEYRAGRLDLRKLIKVPPEPKKDIEMPK
jgi:hypothetical protein